jgi:hypothetical protein
LVHQALHVNQRGFGPSSLTKKEDMKDTYSKYGIEYIMWCMGLYAEDLAKLEEEDPEKYADVMHVRSMIGRSLAKAMR